MTAETPKLVNYLRSLQAVRDRSKLVFDLARAGEVDHWTWHKDKLDEVVQYCMSIIERDFGTDYSKIPRMSSFISVLVPLPSEAQARARDEVHAASGPVPDCRYRAEVVAHCRRNHFLPSFDRITPLLASPSFPSTPLEQAKSLIDLYLVSVLLDAGAGPDWVYTETDEEGAQVWKGGRSEGLAVASLDMFKKGVFSVGKGYTVDAAALKALTPDILAKHLQVSDTNPMAGLEGRCNLLINLGEAIEKRPDVCAGGRPGDMLDYFSTRLTSSPSSSKPILPLSLLWSTLFSLLLPIWPSRTTLPCCPQYALGDIWPVPSLERHLLKSSPTGKLEDGAALVPFHKLTQWLCYSLVEAIESTAGWTVATGVNGLGGGGGSGSGNEPEPSQTGLPEYRNGGLLMDLGLVELRLDSLPEEAKGGKVPRLEAGHPAVVEWRAITVMTLDLIHERICAKLNITADQLSLAQVLEAATWKGGREIAKVRREGGGPPIDIISDGTVF